MIAPLTQAPDLMTDRLRLRGPKRSDLAAFTQWFTTSSRMAILGGNGTEAEARFAFQTNIGRWQMDGMGFFTVTRNDDATPLGRIGLLYYPESDVRTAPEVEAAWFLFDGAEGFGYATEAAKAVLQWGRQELKLDRIVSYILPENLRSRATAERLGASRNGTHAPHDDSADVWVHAGGAA